MILGILLIVLPVVFGLISMILVLKGGYRARKAGCTLAVLIFLIFAGCLAVFTFAGRFVTITMSAGYGVYSRAGSQCVVSVCGIWVPKGSGR
ncbi:MAG: hypothetical protein V8S12_02970 [Lachnospiraceae bacterium]